MVEVVGVVPCAAPWPKTGLLHLTLLGRSNPILHQAHPLRLDRLRRSEDHAFLSRNTDRQNRCGIASR